MRKYHSRNITLICGIAIIFHRPVLCETVGIRSVNLRWDKSAFLTVEHTRLRLQHRYALGDSPHVWMEAEGASYLALEANKTVLFDPAASGGACVAFVEKLVFVIDVREESNYQS